MLKRLSVTNYAIIDALEINFTKGLNVITGETGAGKSILLGALSLILGNRADKKALFNPDQKSIIEGVFLVEGYPIKPFFEAHDLDYEEETIIRREITSSGKSRAFINDTPVTLDILRSLSTQLVDLHRQHDSLSVTGKHFQRQFIDNYAGITAEVKNYSIAYSSYKKDIDQLTILKDEQAKVSQELDFWQFQHKELADANLQAGEVLQTENQLKALNNTEEIQSGLAEASELLDGDEQNILAGLNSILSKLDGLRTFLPELEPLFERFQSATLELDDIHGELAGLASGLEHNPELADQLTQRMDELNRLLSKHNAQDESTLIGIWEELSSKIADAGSFTDDIEQLEQSISNQEKKLEADAAELFAQRESAVPALQTELAKLLAQVGMPNARIAVQLNLTEQLNAYGKDELELLFTANQGVQPQPLKSVASGGELSRLMLAIKTAIAGKTVMPTLIFDEIDTGISGEVAVKVGKLLSQLASNHQLILITHLPQIASRGTSHHYIYKATEGGQTTSRIKTLNKEERIVQIAEMLSGADPSDTSISAARELLGLN